MLIYRDRGQGRVLLQSAEVRSPQNQNRCHSQPSPSSISPDAPDKIRLADILPYDGAPQDRYKKAVDALSTSLMRHNAAVIELESDEAALLRCALESARLFFRARKCGRGSYVYRAGRPPEDVDSSPPCMEDVFRCMGRVARAALCAIARHLRLYSTVFNHLLDDRPLPTNEVSSSLLVAAFSSASLQPLSGASAVEGPVSSSDVEKGLLMLVSSDSPGIQVSDPNGRWYQADSCLGPGELLLLTGKSLSHVTAGLRPAASYRPTPDGFFIPDRGGRTSLAFRLMPNRNAVLDCSGIAAVGHVIPQSYVPISANQFLDAISHENVEEFVHSDDTSVPIVDHLNNEPSLRSVLSDPVSGAFLEDAMQVSCGHSFGGSLLRKVVETAKCVICNSEVDASLLIPNHALRAAAMVVKQKDERRLFNNAAQRKRRKEANEHRENGDANLGSESHRAQYPYSVNEKVVIKGNKRTPDKLVGKEAVITTQCLNGWYLLKIIESGEAYAYSIDH